MKKAIYIILLMCLALSVASCKSKEKVSETFEETSLQTCSENLAETRHNELHEREGYTGQTVQTARKDSLVEKFYERIVVDSCGRILLHDKEYAREGYKGRSRAVAKQSEDSNVSVKAQTDIRQQRDNDSTRIAGRKNMTETAKPPCRWLWFVGLLFFLLITGTIIAKLTK